MPKTTKYLLLLSVVAGISGIMQGQQPHSPAAYYIATDGNDSWSGLLPEPNASHTDGPFATLPRAQVAMQRGSIKTVYIRKGVYYPEPSPDSAAPVSHIQSLIIPVAAKKTYARAGTYHPASSSGAGCRFGGLAAVNLTSADNGETWSYYPPDGYGTAILDGGAPFVTQTGDGNVITGAGVLSCAFELDGPATVTINGLQFQNWNLSAAAASSNGGMSTNAVLIFTNNEVHHTRLGISSPVNLGCVGAGTQITNNYIHDTAFHGIAFETNFGVANDDPYCPVSGVTIANNFLLNTCTWDNRGANDWGGGDCGAIYLLLPHRSNSSITVTNNYIRDVNAVSNGAGLFGNCCSIGIYIDLGYNVSLSGNVVTGKKSICFNVHGGNLRYTGNICDISTQANSVGQFVVDEFVQDGVDAAAGNTYQNNIVVGSGAGTIPTAGWGVYHDDLTGSGTLFPSTITNNDYWNYGGTAISSTNDANPISANPQLSCWAVTIAGGSPASGSPVSFPGITGNWGPPGFVVPQTGTAPSWPHGC